MAIDLYIKLSKLNVSLRVTEGRLDLQAPKGVLNNALLQEIKDHKEDLISLISSNKNHSYSSIRLLSDQPLGYALSSSQYRLWMLSQFDGNTAYNIPGIYLFKGDLNLSALSYSFSQLIERHEILRTVFKTDEKSIVKQHIRDLKSSKFNISYKDLRHESNIDEALRKITKGESESAFNLTEGPLLRAGIYQIENNKWVFLYILHHIISDGWSMEILVKELLQLYTSAISKKSTPLKTLKIQYKDYAAWQQEKLKSGEMEEHKKYWLNQFADDLPILNLPGDKIRPLIKTYAGGIVKRKIDKNITAGLKSLSFNCSGTLFMGLMATLKILLYKYTGQEDIIVGSPVAGREHPDIEDQIGFYVNTLAFRTRFKGSDNFKEIFEKVREITLNGYEHQEYPFDELVKDLNLQSDMSRSALFDVMIVLQNTHIDHQDNENKLGELVVSEYPQLENQTSKFDLTFSFGESGEELQTIIEYNSDIYSQNTINIMAEHFIQLLSAITINPTLPVQEIIYLSKKENHQLLIDFNDTETNYNRSKTIADIFESQALDTPDQTALIYEEKEYSYRALSEITNQLSRHLKNKYKIRADDLIGIKLERSDWSVIAILSIIKAGAAYVPIDVDYPQDRINYIINDSKCKAIVDEDELAEFNKVRAKYSKKPQKITNTPNDLAYIMYTSGTTGHPNGVMIEHKSVIRLIRSINHLPLTGKEILLSTGAISFDATTFEFWGILLNGGKLIICSKDVLLDPKRIKAEIETKQINTMWFTSGFLNQLVDTDIEIFKGLKTIVAGGDRLSYVHINALKNKYPKLKIINGYGPTENTTFSLTYEVKSTLVNIPIGKPISNSKVYILDNQNQLVPIGVVGEICLGGEGLARGYLNQEKLTNAKFIDNPFTANERLYKSGDLGRWLSNGNIEFIGRKDDQVKIRGYRIELGEIEHVLQKHPAIISAIVSVKDSPGEDKILFAYIVSREALDISEIRIYLGKMLPSYMIPNHFIQVEKLPLTQNGKVDKNKLSDIKVKTTEPTAAYFIPQNHVEEKLLSIWQKALGKENIGVNDNFFEQGGNSLLIIQILHSIKHELKIDISPKSFFQNNTISLLSKMLQTVEENGINNCVLGNS